MLEIIFDGVNKVYSNHVHAVIDFNLTVKENEFVVFVGPSGCGKSTTLRMLAGLEEISSGEIKIDGVVVNHVEPKDRGIAMVFQNYALYPHMTVRQNMSFALETCQIPVSSPALGLEDKKEIESLRASIREWEKQDKKCAEKRHEKQVADAKKRIEEIKAHSTGVVKTRLAHMPKKEIDERVNAAAEILGLTQYLDKKPKELSGGQRQRVALGRVIVRKPKVFLMDEPLSNLDAKLRASMRVEITKIHKRVGATTIYVTHDQTEAMTMADRIVVMKDGLVQQIGTPAEVYNDPANLFVATFIGTPAMNVFEGKLTRETLSFLNIEEKAPANLYDRLNELYEHYIAEAKEDIEELQRLIASHPIKKKRAFTKKAKKEEQERLSNPLTYENQLKAKTERLSLALSAREAETKTVKIGVRPSDILPKETKKAPTTDPIAFDVEETELLGHDLLVHLCQGETRLVASLAAKDVPSVGREYVLDENSLYYFDPISAQRIYLKGE